MDLYEALLHLQNSVERQEAQESKLRETLSLEREKERLCVRETEQIRFDIEKKATALGSKRASLCLAGAEIQALTTHIEDINTRNRATLLSREAAEIALLARMQTSLTPPLSYGSPLQKVRAQAPEQEEALKIGASISAKRARIAELERERQLCEESFSSVKESARQAIQTHNRIKSQLEEAKAQRAAASLAQAKAKVAAKKNDK